jgi:hypothetical protein
MRNGPEHHEQRAERQEAIAAHKRIHHLRREHAKAVAAAAEACRLAGRSDLADQLDTMALHVWHTMAM